MLKICMFQKIGKKKNYFFFIWGQPSLDWDNPVGQGRPLLWFILLFFILFLLFVYFLFLYILFFLISFFLRLLSLRDISEYWRGRVNFPAFITFSYLFVLLYFLFFYFFILLFFFYFFFSAPHFSKRY